MPDPSDQDPSIGAIDHAREHAAPVRTSNVSNRYSIASTETGESSKRNSTIESPSTDVAEGISELSGITATSHDARRGHHRSHRGRGSESFLLSTSIADPVHDQKQSSDSVGMRHRDSNRQGKGKATTRSSDKGHGKRKSQTGHGIASSPLATNITAAGNGQIDTINVDNPTKDEVERPSTALDVDSAQIVNLALNLSESRRNLGRRNVSSPVSSAIPGYGESSAGGSLRQHLQQQRRISRNISPKPGKLERSFTGSSRGGQGDRERVNSPLQSNFHPQADGDYHYQFSASTLARAEKARVTLELMAEYRRLLQHVPPLKPRPRSISITASPPNTTPGSPTASGLPVSRTVSATRALGRVYNPLQYIRNRKVRVRERKAIDGESLGFGDVALVSAWVDNIAHASQNEDYQSSDCVALPPLLPGSEPGAFHATPNSPGGKGQANAAKIKRPRIDWMTSPADLLADVSWLEQEDHKKLIEDRLGRKIFPQYMNLVRSPTHQGEGTKEAEPHEEDVEMEEPEQSLRLDTDLPSFRHLRRSTHREPDSKRMTARETLHYAAHLPEELNRIGHEHHLLKAYPSNRPDSDTSDNEVILGKTGRKRGNTMDSQDLGHDILEKQMREMMEKEENEQISKSARPVKAETVIQSIESPQLSSREDTRLSEPTSSTHRRNDSIRQTGDSQPSSHRASLEVPIYRGRGSLEGLDSTAPNSPQITASESGNAYIPSIGMDLSPPPSRRSSPTRKPPLEKVMSKIQLFGDRSRDRSRERSERGNSVDFDAKLEWTNSAPATPEARRRSQSPSKTNSRSKTEGLSKPAIARPAIIRRKDDEPSGIRALFKGGRNPVSRVSELLWKKESSPASAATSDTSTDESESEDEPHEQDKEKKEAHSSGVKGSPFDISDGVSPRKEIRSYFTDLPSFSSPFERRGRSRGLQPENADSRESNRGSKDRSQPRYSLLKPPRIDVQTASVPSSPDMPPADGSSRNSEISDLDVRRKSDASGVQGADARLNAILGLPGTLRSPEQAGLPVTGLYNLENRRPSIVGKRSWSMTEREASNLTGPTAKRELARLRALLLSSGVKAKEIMRHASELKDLRDSDQSYYTEIADFNRDHQLLKPVPRFQEHVLAARILSDDIQLSSRIWQDSAQKFSAQTMNELMHHIEDLQQRITGRNGLSEMSRRAGDEADQVSADLVTGQTLKVKELMETMNRMMRRRHRRFRWVRRGGWVLLEWFLVGVMWWVWLVVVLIRAVRGVAGGLVGGVRWLLWL